MPRIPRTYAPDGVYHILSRGNNRARIFHDHHDYRSFLQIVGHYKKVFGFKLYHYCLMPNHVHFTIQPNSEMPKFMQRIKLTYSKVFRDRYAFVGHVWQGRYKSLHIDNDAYLLACGNYIEMNPVRAGLVTKPENWPYSSYRFYAYGEKNTLVDMDPLYLSLGQTPAERQSRYRSLAGNTRQPLIGPGT